jgi:hypothetical protein
VFEAEKDDLDRELVSLRPADLVVCSRLTSRVEDQVASWVELYSDDGPPRWSACWVKAQPSRRYNSPTCSPLWTVHLTRRGKLPYTLGVGPESSRAGP